MTESRSTPLSQRELSLVAEALDAVKYDGDSDDANNITVGVLRAICGFALRPAALSETATPSEQSVKDARRLWTEDTDPLVESVCRELLRLAGDKNAAPQLHGEGLAQNTPSAAPIAESASRCVAATTGPLTLDTDGQVFFYEQDHYYLSNFSAFRVNWAGHDFDTSEHAYQWYRFNRFSAERQAGILMARSAHEAFRYAQDNKVYQRPDWDDMKVGVMRDILLAKARQHEYVRRKLLQTGTRTLIENSWRDAFWGWGENRDGQNMLGKLWMEVRAELRAGERPLP